MTRKAKPEELVRAELRELKPYRSPDFKHRIKMDLNESPYDLPGEIKEEVFERMRSLRWHRYHDEFEEPLREAFADYVGHTADGVLFGNGSNELIFHTLLAAVRPEGAVVYPEPSFSLYRQNTVVLGGTPVPFRLAGDDFSVDPVKVIELARSRKAKAVVLCSPNNPTGGRTPNGVIEKIAGSLEAVIIVDEAYSEFAEGHAAPLLGSCPNLVLLRTFSKAVGLAGLRMGFALCAPDLATQIRKVQLPHHVNFFTQVAALTVLNQRGLIARRAADLKQGRADLLKALEGLDGVRPYPSETNFLLVELERKTPDEVFRALLDRGILVRNISNYPGLSRCLRISVGLPQENQALVSALAEVLG